MSESTPDKITFELHGRDVSLGSTVKKGVADAQKSAEQAAARMPSVGQPAFYGPAVRPRFDREERALRDRVAGRMQAERDTYLRQERDQRTRQMLAERQNERLSRRAQIGGADTGVVFGPPPRERAVGVDTGEYFGPAVRPRFTPEERAIRSTQADMVKSMRDEERERRHQTEARRRLFGEEQQNGLQAEAEAGPINGPAVRSRYSQGESEVRREQARMIRQMREDGRRAQVEAAARERLFGPESKGIKLDKGVRGLRQLMGGGEAAMAGFIGDKLAATAADLREAAEGLRSGAMKWDEAGEKVARGLPIIGGFVSAGRDIKEAFSLGSGLIEREIGDKDIKDIRTGWRGWVNAINPSPIKFTNASEVAQQRKEQMENEAKNSVLEREARLAGRGLGYDRQRIVADRRATFSRGQLDDRFGSRRNAYMTEEELARRQRERALAEAEISRQSALESAAIKREQDRKAATEYENTHVTPTMDKGQKAVANAAVKAMRMKADEEYLAATEKANQDYRHLQEQSAGEEISQEQRKLERISSLRSRFREDREANFRDQAASELALRGYTLAAELRQIENAAEQEKAARQQAFDEQTKWMKKTDPEYQALSNKKTQEDRNTDRQRDNQGERARQADNFRRADQTFGDDQRHDSNLAGAAQVRLRAVGRDRDAEKLAIEAELAMRIAAIKQEQAERDRLHKNERQKNEDEALRQIGDATDYANAQKLALRLRGAGPSIDRSQISTEGRLGGRLTYADTYMRKAPEGDPNTAKQTQEIKTYFDQKLAAFSKELGAEVGRAIKGLFSTTGW